MRTHIIDYDDITEKENIIFLKLHFVFAFIRTFILVPIVTLLFIFILDFVITYPFYYVTQLFSKIFQ